MNKPMVYVDHDAYCAQGQHRAPKAGGEWIVSKDGKTKRWICAGCLAKRLQAVQVSGAPD